MPLFIEVDALDTFKTDKKVPFMLPLSLIFLT